MPMPMRLAAITALLCIPIVSNARTPVLESDAHGTPRPQYFDRIFRDDNMPESDSESCAIFRKCRFVCNSDTLFLARHANQMALIDCEILGDCVVMWSRCPQQGDRNYQYALTMNGSDYVIGGDSPVTIELDGLPLAGELMKEEPEHATMMTLSLAGSGHGDGNPETDGCLAVATVDYPLEAGFLGWHSSDDRIGLEPLGDGTVCRILPRGGSSFGAQIEAYGLNGVEGALYVVVENGAVSLCSDPEVAVELINPQRKGLFKRLFKRREK